MTTITHAQARALEVITKELDKIAPGRGIDYMDVILGVLNIEMPTKVEYKIYDEICTGIGIDTHIAHNEPIVISTPDIYQPIGNEDLQTNITCDPTLEYPYYGEVPKTLQDYHQTSTMTTGDFRDIQTSFNDK